MKASELTPTTFEYDADHWTAPTTLNPTDISLDNTDAKFAGFNNMLVTELLANFPDLGPGLQWRVGRFVATTALNFFQTSAVLSVRDPKPSRPPLRGNARGKTFSTFEKMIFEEREKCPLLHPQVALPLTQSLMMVVLCGSHDADRPTELPRILDGLLFTPR